MPFGTYETPKYPAIPTFLQYVKDANASIEGKTKFGVDIVWMPGRFQNVTLQTHAFRYIANEDHALFVEFLLYSETIVPGVSYPRLEIVITSIRERTIELLDTSKKKGQWEALGSNALKFVE